ncbi:NAD kinase 2, mitochondrial-like [Liolophura sinensis]|uniref:NAD kinase 2, mitochondrial-like n=1 Tax=Liolophura sinensis TaxID=3198878 RepID=UPI0031594702
MNLWPIAMCFRRVLHQCVCPLPKRPGSRLSAYLNSRHAATGHFVDDQPGFSPKRAVLLTKMTRYEYEKKVCGAKTDNELKKYLDSKRSDFQGLLERHRSHHNCVENIKKCLLSQDIETKVVERFHASPEVLEWADVVFTAGGDGTFLLGASKVNSRDKPVIGINTDPDKSEGHLCLPKGDYSAMKFTAALDRLLKGDFRWRWRQRIRITVSGQHANDDPIELHDQQLQFPEHRFSEEVKELETFQPRRDYLTVQPPRVLPVRALNEVFIGESLSSRVSYYELTVDEGSGQKQKSSGITVCTGTGSTSWSFHINHLSMEAVRQLLDIVRDTSKEALPMINDTTLEEVVTRFNNSLMYDPSDLKMAFTIRDPLINGVFQVSTPRGFAKKIQVRSRMWDACLVVDGGSSFKFNDGAIATMEMLEEDALRTVTFD